MEEGVVPGVPRRLPGEMPKAPEARTLDLRSLPEKADEPPSDGAPTMCFTRPASAPPESSAPLADSSPATPPPTESPRIASSVPPSTPAPTISPQRVSLPPASPARSIWSAELEGRKLSPNRRALSPRMKACIICGAGLVALTLLASRRTKPGSADAPRLVLASELVVSEKDLQNRREVSADDFRPRNAPSVRSGTPPLEPRPAAPIDDALGAIAPSDLEERRARRRNDPEDIIGKRYSSHGLTTAAGVGSPAPAGADAVDDDFFVKPSASSMRSPAPSPKPEAPDPLAPHVLASSGTTISAVLASPVRVSGASVTVVAKVTVPTGEIPVGTRLLGSATTSEDRVLVRFRTMVLPDGRELRITAEARDKQGNLGLVADVEPGSSTDDGPSVGEDIARDTTAQVLGDGLGGGLAGAAASRYVREAPRRRSLGSGSRSTLTLPKETSLLVFFSESVRER